MRLIDADALMKEFAEYVKHSNNSDFAKTPTWNDAVSLLGSAPTIEPEPCEDAVSREAAIKCCTFGRTSLGLIGELRRLPSVTPKQRWIPCVDGNEPKANAGCWISTNAKYVRRASYAPKANNQPNGFIVTVGGFGFYEYGKSAKAWMPYEEPEPFREEGETE